MSGRCVKDEIGNHYGRWTVIKQANSRNHSAMWLCHCDCGTERVIKGSSLRSGHTKSCGCVHRVLCDHSEVKSRERRSLSPCQAAINRLFTQYRSGARRKGRVFALSLSEFESLTSSACHYCGASPQNVFHGWKGKGTYKYNGIDRVDSDDGYVVANCVPCCTMCNMAKAATPAGEFRNWVAQVCEHMFCPSS